MQGANRIAIVTGVLLAAGLLLFSFSRGFINAVTIERPLATALCLLAGGILVYARRLRPLRNRFTSTLFGSSAKAFNLALFLLGSLFYAVVSWSVFDAVPHLDDDVVALFQARIFATFRVTLPLPVHPEFFWQHFVLDPRFGFDRLCGMYPPGHPALLTPGVLLGVAWLVTPLLGGALVVAIVALAYQLYGRRISRIAGLFALLSPFLALLSATHLSHVPTALFCTLCMWSTCRLLQTRRWAFGALAGLSLAVAFLCRPLTTVVVGIVIGLGPAWYWRRWPHLWKGLLAALFAVACGIAMLLIWQHVTTGNFLTPGHTIGIGRRAKFGFGVIDWARIHTPAVGIRYSVLRLKVLNAKVLGFPIPTYLIALIPLLLGRARRADVWLLLPSIALLLTYCPYWYFEDYYPARYLFSGVPMLIILAARGYDCLVQRMAETRSLRMRRVPAAILAGSFCFQLAVFTPDYFDSFPSYHGDVESVLPKVVRDYDITHAVVFIDAIEPMTYLNDKFNDFYATGFMRNTLTFDGDVIYARNLREENGRLAALYPERDLYFYRYIRSINKAYLYRVTFEGGKPHAIPVRPHTRDLAMPPE